MSTARRRLASASSTTVLVAVLLASASASSSAWAGGGVPPTRATPAQRELAQSRFLRAKELQAAGKLDQALVELEASLDVVSSPNTRLVMGRCHRQLGHLVAAYAELGHAAVEAKELAREDPRYEKAAEAANAERNEIAPKLGFVAISIANAEPGTSLKVANEEVRRGGWNELVPVMPGTTEIRLETPGRAAVTRTVTLAAGQTSAVSLDATAGAAEAPASAASPPVDTTDAGSSKEPTKLRPYAYVAGGVALVGLGTFLVAGSMANGTFSDLQNTCGSGPCPPGHEDQVSKGRTQQTLANVGLGVFVVGAAAGVTLFVLSRPKNATSAFARASVVGSPSWVGLKGAF